MYLRGWPAALNYSSKKGESTRRNERTKLDRQDWKFTQVEVTTQVGCHSSQHARKRESDGKVQSRGRENTKSEDMTKTRSVYHPLAMTKESEAFSASLDGGCCITDRGFMIYCRSTLGRVDLADKRLSRVEVLVHLLRFFFSPSRFDAKVLHRGRSTFTGSKSAKPCRSGKLKKKLPWY